MERKDLTVIGDVVNVAERIESLSEPNLIAIAESTFSRLNIAKAELFEFDQKVQVKGKEQPIAIYRYSKDKK